MYGLIHCCVEDMIMKTFNEETWTEIVKCSKLLHVGTSFLIHHIYPDEETLQLVGAVCQVTGWDISTFMENFGVHFFPYCELNDFDRLMRVLGNNLEDFLTNVDFLHNFLASLYPGMQSPSFRCRRGPDNTLLLHYHSQRHGMQGIAKGLVKKLALELFETEVVIEESLLKIADGDNHILFKIACAEKQKHPRLLSWPAEMPVHHLAQKDTPGQTKDQDICTENNDTNHINISMATFCEAFPFHMIFSGQFRIKQVGKALRRVLRHVWQKGEDRLFSLFCINRPVLEATFDSILDHLNATFVLQTLPGILTADNESIVLKLKGQMVFMSESSSMLFLGSPRETDLQEMAVQKIYFSDFRIHDVTRELVLKKYAQRSERELTMKLEETHNQLKITKEQLKADQQRTNDLLHSILPSKVAVALCSNIPVPAEAFDVVTVLFSDIVSFTAMCSSETVKPMDIVHVLNRMYTLFDHLSNYYKLYKVETIGDAYMAASGIPDFVETHADQAVAMGMDMVKLVREVLNPDNQQPIQIRVGIHSGPVLAGVVGQQMPRYCLIGNTVTLGNKLESNSLPGRVNISKETMSHLTEDGYVFTKNPVPNFPVHCFLVDSNPQGAINASRLFEMQNVDEICEKEGPPSRLATPLPELDEELHSASSTAVKIHEEIPADLGEEKYPHSLKSQCAQDTSLISQASLEVTRLAAAYSTTKINFPITNFDETGNRCLVAKQPFEFGRNFFPPRKASNLSKNIPNLRSTGIVPHKIINQASSQTQEQELCRKKIPSFCSRFTVKKSQNGMTDSPLWRLLCKPTLQPDNEKNDSSDSSQIPKTVRSIVN